MRVAGRHCAGCHGEFCRRKNQHSNTQTRMHAFLHHFVYYCNFSHCHAPPTQLSASRSCPQPPSATFILLQLRMLSNTTCQKLCSENPTIPPADAAFINERIREKYTHN